MLYNEVLFHVLLVFVGFGSFFLCVILCWCFFFPAKCSTMICEYVIFLCPLLYCAIDRFSCYYACSCRPDLFIQSVMPVGSGHVKVKIVFVLLTVHFSCTVRQKTPGSH
jgi:hypothetical protein